MNNSNCSDRFNNYIRLNVGGNLFCTTIGTLLCGNTMLNAMFSGRMEVKTDEEGWVLIDRSGKHFGTILNYLRDAHVPLPENRRELTELMIEARFYCIEGLQSICEEELSRMVVDEDRVNRAAIIIVKCSNAAKCLLSSTMKVEFPESRIHEEMLFLLAIARRCLTDAELGDLAKRKVNNNCSAAVAIQALGHDDLATTLTSNDSVDLVGSSNRGDPPARPAAFDPATNSNLGHHASTPPSSLASSSRHSTTSSRIGGGRNRN